MTLGYSKQFPWGEPTLFREKILNGNMENTELKPKLHSFREDPSDRWRPGMDIHHCYDTRTSNRQCFLVNKCISVQRIQIIKTAVTGVDLQGNDVVAGSANLVLVDGRTMSDTKIEEMAINDGFNSVEDFFRWFNKDFAGKIIHWTKLRY